jgi:ribonuclease HI
VVTLVLEPLVYYTDGSCWPNPGPGGWAVVKEVGEGEYEAVGVGSAILTTNVQMEGQALIEAMVITSGLTAVIHTDSLFWVQAMTEWASVWERSGWKNSNHEQVKNLVMVKHLWGLYQRGNVGLRWVRGHSGFAGNEYADQVADAARRGREPFTRPEMRTA